MTLAVLDSIPLWVVFVFTVMLLFLAAETAFLISRKRSEKRGDVGTGSSGTVLGAILGLLAFLLAFTFGMAHSVHKERHALVIEDANAIGTAFLRTQLIPTEQGRPMQQLLLEYVQLRRKAAGSRSIRELRPLIERSERIHDELWKLTRQLGDTDIQPVYVGLIVNSVNTVIDLQTKRVTAVLGTRIPSSIMLTLYFVAILAMALVGSQAGKTGSRSLVTRVMLILAFSAVVLLIIELDRPTKTMIQVDQNAMIDIENKIVSAMQ